jgi:hypothetical protein
MARTSLLSAGCGFACLAAATASPAPDANAPYPKMAPIAQYAMPSPAAEIALARSAAPASISDSAEILVLGAHGYETAVRGKNGFVCLVVRSWDAGFSDPEFWNPKLRSPQCLNAAAVKTVLPHFLERTQWVLSGASKAEMLNRTRFELASDAYVLPAPGSVSFMMSRDQFTHNADGHWHPHLMFFVANTDAAAWGASLPGSPIIAGHADPEPVTIFLIPVPKWSDGTPAEMAM